MKPMMRVRRAKASDPAFRARFFGTFFAAGGPSWPLVWPLARAARALGACDDFPPVLALERVFDGVAGGPPVRFEVAAPRPRRRGALEPRALYDARITLDRVVPTRERSWHDLMNALAWGTFPLAKVALHARQHHAIAARIEPDARRLPPTRTPELDALALLDEGGVVIVADDAQRLRAAFDAGADDALKAEVSRGGAVALVFGHAIYETLALGVSPAVLAAIVVPRQARQTHDEQDLVRDADAGLARVPADSSRLVTPTELKRVELTSTARPACATHPAPPR